MFSIRMTDIAGPMLLGLLVNSGLYGVLCAQIYTYYMAFPSDRIAFKILVYGCLASESLHTLSLSINGLDVFVTHLGDTSSFDKARLYWVLINAVTAVVVATSQLLYAYRLKVIYKSYTLPISVTLLSICAAIVQLIIGARIHVSGRLSSVFADSSILVIVCFLATILCDTAITVSIVYYLLRQRPISNSRLNYQIKHLIRLIIETSVFTATTHILSFVLFVCYRNTVYFVVPYVMSSKLSSNTLVLMFNNRILIHGGRNDVDDCGNIVSHWIADMESRLREESSETQSQIGSGLVLHGELVLVNGANSDIVGGVYTHDNDIAEATQVGIVAIC
ncbi:hypothetical protein BDZ94DRAFT_1258745 [Collybia nuda]|uniref:DUF6534 domain-containing protein n=1 Tax=Collybia nuda TaxID=64659 RepID=A0A9P6CF01_9AGAR|nr:hypothetical protein BDZ94DRAFT_1258745 [Collybia nuda]